MKPPMFTATGIGSMPFDDPEYAVGAVLRHFPEAPFWPQLPALGPREDMVAQYSESMPGVRIDTAGQKTVMDTGRDLSDELEAFYAAYLDAESDAGATSSWARFALTPSFSQGIGPFENALAGSTQRPFVKVHTTGPCTFALSCQDAEGLPVYYRQELRDVVVKALAMNSRSQIRRFRRYAQETICFVDEPALAAFGSSSYVGVQREDVLDLLREVVDAIHLEGAVAGMHCCGNTDWSIPIEAGVDIVNFDAYEYGETIARYRAPVRALFDRDGALAWGIVPTSAAIREETVDTLADRLDRAMAVLAGKGFDRDEIARQAMITPACGAGCMEPADAKRVFAATAALGALLRTRYGWTGTEAR